MSGQDCRVFATATQYGTSRQVVYQTNVYSTQVVSNNATLQYPVTVVQSYTSASVFATGTLYGTSCAAAATSSAAAAAGVIGTITTTATSGAQASPAASVTTGVTVQTQSSLVTGAGGNVETRTVLYTASGTVQIVTQTASASGSARNVNSDGSLETKSPVQSHVGAIAGGIVGAVLLFVLLALLAWCVRKRHKRARDTRNLDDYFNDPTSAGWRPEEGQGIGNTSRRGSTFFVGSLSRRRSEDGVVDLERESRRSNEKANWAELVADDTYMTPNAEEREEMTEIPNGRPSRELSFVSPPSRAASPRSGEGRSRPTSIRERTQDATANTSRAVSFSSGDMRQMSPRLRPLSEFQGADPDWENALTTSPQMSPVAHYSPDANEQFQSLPSRQMLKNRSMSGLAVQVPERPASALGLARSGTTSRSIAGPSYGPSPPRSPQSTQGPFAQTPSRRTSALRATPNRAGSVTYGNLYATQHWPAHPHAPVPQRSMPARSFSGDNFPPSRYAHLDIPDPDAVQAEEAAQAAGNGRAEVSAPSHARTLSTGSLGPSSPAIVAPRPILKAGSASHGSSLYASGPRQSFFVVGGPERSRSVLSIRNASPDDGEEESTVQHHAHATPGVAAPILAAPLVQRDDSNTSSDSNVSAASAVSAVPSTPLTPQSPNASTAIRPSKDPLSRAGSLANADDVLASKTQPRGGWTPSKWLVRGSSIVRP